MKLADFGRSTRRLVALEAAIVVGYGALAAAAAIQHTWLFLALLVLTAALDELAGRVPQIVPVLRTAQLGCPTGA